jgi:hypothetical protein
MCWSCVQNFKIIFISNCSQKSIILSIASDRVGLWPTPALRQSHSSPGQHFFSIIRFVSFEQPPYSHPTLKHLFKWSVLTNLKI